jgi:hypothetical protein
MQRGHAQHGFGEVPNHRQRNHGSNKADYKNVQRVGVGLSKCPGAATMHEFVGVVFHSILHHHDENVGALSDFLCGIFAHHKTDNAAPGTKP